MNGAGRGNFRTSFCRGVAQPGSASALGAESRGFKSRRPDHLSMVRINESNRNSGWFSCLNGHGCIGV